jgi:hypothetical protein
VPARSRRLLTRALLAAMLGFAAALVVACGSSGSGKGLLSADESRTISSALDAVSSAVHAHSCARAKTALTALDDSLQNLSDGTNSKLVHNLGHGASTVSQVALTQCHQQATTTTTSSTTTTTSSTVATTTSTPTTTTTLSVPTTQSTPTTISTPQTTPATTPSTSTPGNGNGNGNGGGGGGGAGLTGQGPQ